MACSEVLCLDLRHAQKPAPDPGGIALDRGYPRASCPPFVIGEQDDLRVLQEGLDPDDGQELVVADARPGMDTLDAVNWCPLGGGITHVIRADVASSAQPGVPHGDRHWSSGTERKIKKG